MNAALTIDLLSRGGALALLGLWTAILWRDHRAVLSARVAMAMNTSIAAYIANGFLRTPGALTSPGLVTDFLAVFAPPLFWLFALTWFNDILRIGWRRWLAVSSILALYLAQMAHILSTGEFSAAVWIAMRLAMTGFAMAGLWEAWRGRESDLIEERRRFRILLIGTIGVFVIAINAIEALAIARVVPGGARTVIQPGILLFAFLICAAMFAVARPALFAAPDVPAAALDKPAAAPSALRLKLLEFMALQRPYRSEALTIAALAGQLGEQEYRLRRLINGELGYRNFAQFLNRYRLDEVRAALADPAQREVPILTIALDAGFGSLGPFNRAFREAEDMTPSEWRQRALADSGIG